MECESVPEQRSWIAQTRKTRFILGGPKENKGHTRKTRWLDAELRPKSGLGVRGVSGIVGEPKLRASATQKLNISASITLAVRLATTPHDSRSLHHRSRQLDPIEDGPLRLQAKASRREGRKTGL